MIRPLASAAAAAVMIPSLAVAQPYEGHGRAPAHACPSWTCPAWDHRVEALRYEPRWVEPAYPGPDPAQGRRRDYTPYDSAYYPPPYGYTYGSANGYGYGYSYPARIYPGVSGGSRR